MKWLQYDIRNFTDADYLECYALMSREKQTRVNNFRLADDKKRTVAGDMLARKAVSAWRGVSPASIRFAANKYGKPRAVDLNVEFNISHSENIVVCAIDDKPVGIDVERIRPLDLSAAKYICNAEELVYLFGRYPCEEDFCHTENTAILIRFFELWTSKEALGKCEGIGLSDPKRCKLKNISLHRIYEQYIVAIKETR